MAAKIEKEARLIQTTWSGTAIEAWMPLKTLQTIPSMAARLGNLKKWKQNTDKMKAKLAKEQKQFQLSRKMLQTREAELNQANNLADIDLPEKKWKTMKVPANWESQGLAYFDGLVWFRKEITIPNTWAGKDIVLNLGAHRRN